MPAISAEMKLVDKLTSPIETMINAVYALTEGLSVADVQLSDGFNVSNILNDVDLASNKIKDIHNEIERMSTATIPKPHVWENDTQIFTNTGVDRFQQELNATNTLMSKLNKEQHSISQQALAMEILPSNAVNDIIGLANRLDRVRNQIAQIENNPLDLNSNSASNELERLRGQLTQMISLQDDLSNSMTSMDLGEINRAYTQLNHTVGSTERYIRDNINAQEDLNNTVTRGFNLFDNLKNKILGIGAAYAGAQGVKALVGGSDEKTLTDARLKLVVDDDSSIEELKGKLMSVADDARLNYTDLAQSFTKLDMNAGKAFVNDDEVLRFTELMGKNFKVGGASDTEQAAAMYQLTQAMSSGKLQGDEYRSIIENAPLLANSIEDYMIKVKHAQGSMKDWAADGLLTADVIKEAMFRSADDVNKQFETIPMTWDDIGNEISNDATSTFSGVYQKINDIANADYMPSIISGVGSAMAVLASILGFIVDGVGSTAEFMVNNWSMLEPIILGVGVALGIYTGYLLVSNGIELISNGIKVASTIASLAKVAVTGAEVGATLAATAAQQGLNVALYACPITWIIIAVIALVAIFYSAIAAINHFAGTSISATGVVMGVFFTFGAYVANQFIFIWNYVVNFVNFFANVFNDPVASVEILFLDMASNVVSYISTMASAIEGMINRIPGVQVDITAGLDNFQNQIDRMSANIKSKSEWEEVVSKQEFIDLGSAYNTGYNIGEGFANKVSGYVDTAKDYMTNGLEVPETNIPGLDDQNKTLKDIADNTANTKNSIDATKEEIKYMLDITKSRAIERVTKHEYHIEQTNHNSINSSLDLDTVTSHFLGGLTVAKDTQPEGVHA